MNSSILLAVATCALSIGPIAFSAEERPNIVFILADDLGYADLSCYGAEGIETPAIDQLASEGLRFTQLYATGAQCTPSRVGFLTGRYPQRVGGLECAIGTGNVGRYDHAINLAQRHDLGLPAEHATLAPALDSAGYRNILVGKWHLGYENKFHPLDQGFEEFFGFLGGYVDYYFHEERSPIKVFLEGRDPIDRDGYMTDLLTERAVSFIERDHHAPFFLFLSHATPHSPYQGPDESPTEPFTGRLVAGDRETYIKMVESFDNSVAMVTQALKSQGLADDTLIIVTSDHGGKPLGSNQPFSGFKSSLYEGGIRIPLLLRWPGRIQAGSVSHQTGTLMDITASLIRAADADVSSSELDGIDILDRIQAGLPEIPRTLFWRYRRGEKTSWAVRDSNRKYIRIRIRNDSGDREFLFNLAADPAEQHNDLKTHPLEAERLRRLLASWETEVYTKRGRR